MDYTKVLEGAIKNYSFPAVYFDFESGVEVVNNSMVTVEREINNKLFSKSNKDVKDGLSNVIYWGYSQIGYRDKRVYDFRENVEDESIYKFIDLIKKNRINLIEIKKLRLPQFSGMSFVSKILMFIDPINFCVLDKQIAKLRNEQNYGTENCLDELVYKKDDTQIRITVKNTNAYNKWRNTCLTISKSYYNSKYRCVDIERGFFALIQSGKQNIAQKILNSFYA